jgi:ribosomal protein S17E
MGGGSSASSTGSQGSRVKRVASGVMEQAQNAVVSGFETVKELGENLVDRVSS